MAALVPPGGGRGKTDRLPGVRPPAEGPTTLGVSGGVAAAAHDGLRPWPAQVSIRRAFSGLLRAAARQRAAVVGQGSPFVAVFVRGPPLRVPKAFLPETLRR